MIIIDTNDNVAAQLPFLKSKGVVAIGRYYSSSAWKRITKAEAAAISSAGIEIFVVFEDRGDPVLSVDRGIHDAQIALGQAKGIGQPTGSAIYFAMEHLPDGYTHVHVPGIKLYFEGVRQVLEAAYKIGVYSDGVVLDALLDSGHCEFAWLSASTAFEGSKDFDKSGRWALAQRRIDLDWSGLSIDTNDAKPEFGAFLIDTAQPAAGDGAGPMAAAPAMAAPAAPAAAASGWTFKVQRLREEKREGEGYKRTVGTYQVYHDGVAVIGLSGMTVERQGPGNNGLVGKREHRCIAAGSYPLNSHATSNYKTVGYKTTGAHPRPAIEVGDTDKRDGILIHPADGYGSTIGCINLSGALEDEDSDIEFSDSFQRVVDVINDLKRFLGGVIPTGNGVPLASCSLIVQDPAVAHVAGGLPGFAAAPRYAAMAAARAAPPPAAAAGGIIDCDVVIQAGHEDTPDGATGGEGPLGKEIDWTPIVANEAVRLLRAAGVKAIKETAHIKVTNQTYSCKLALFIHFDDPNHGESGPSVGYRHSSDSPAAQEWKTLYKQFFPFNEMWHNDNYTRDEHHYYGFKYTVTSDGEFLIELGDLNSLRQAQWLKPRLTWLGNLIAYYVSNRIGQGGIPKPAAFTGAGPQPLGMALAAAQPVGAPVPFTTRPSISGNAGGSSKTRGLNGTRQTLADGTIVIEATEAMSATRSDGLDATLTAFQRRVEKDGVITVEQNKYSYRNRQLPQSVLFRQIAAFPGAVPAGFVATAVRPVVASQFGKNDREDEGTGSPIMGLIQTNSEVFGASIKASAMARVFGAGWRTSDKRLSALVEILFPSKQRLVRVPLVDIGPGETIRAEVDLTWACDQFLGTEGQADVEYRVLVPV